MIKKSFLVLSLLGILIGSSFASFNYSSAQQAITNNTNSDLGWTGEIITYPILMENLLNVVKVNLTDAIDTSIADVGQGSKAIDANLVTSNGYLVYSISVIDNKFEEHSVIVDPSSGKVLDNFKVPYTYNGTSDAPIIAFDEPAEDGVGNTTTIN